MEITRKRVADLTPSEYKDCWWLNFGSEGFMRDELEIQRKGPWRKGAKPASVVMARKDDRLIGWALVFQDSYAATTVLIDREAGTVAPRNSWHVYVYVRYKFRRHGLGTMLLKEARRGRKHVVVWPHDDRSGGFFKARAEKCIIDLRDMEWLEPEKENA